VDLLEQTKGGEWLEPIQRPGPPDKHAHKNDKTLSEHIRPYLSIGALCGSTCSIIRRRSRNNHANLTSMLMDKTKREYKIIPVDWCLA